LAPDGGEFAQFAMETLHFLQRFELNLDVWIAVPAYGRHERFAVKEVGCAPFAFGEDGVGNHDLYGALISTAVVVNVNAPARLGVALDVFGRFSHHVVGDGGHLTGSNLYSPMFPRPRYPNGIVHP
jgi:hypothetical protein